MHVRPFHVGAGICCYCQSFGRRRWGDTYGCICSGAMMGGCGTSPLRVDPVPSLEWLVLPRRLTNPDPMPSAASIVDALALLLAADPLRVDGLAVDVVGTTSSRAMPSAASSTSSSSSDSDTALSCTADSAASKSSQSWSASSNGLPFLPAPVSICGAGSVQRPGQSIGWRASSGRSSEKNACAFNASGLLFGMAPRRSAGLSG